MQFKQNLWAMIIGASGGIGYAAAEMPATHVISIRGQRQTVFTVGK